MLPEVPDGKDPTEEVQAGALAPAVWSAPTRNPARSLTYVPEESSAEVQPYDGYPKPPHRISLCAFRLVRRMWFTVRSAALARFH